MTQLENVLELMHYVQSCLPVKEATRTSVLSKSWLHAWSTIPNLRFRVFKERRQRNHIKLVEVDRMLARYLRDNISIETFDLIIDIENQDSYSLVEELIRTVATKTCVKELFLTVHPYSASFNFPVEILSAKKLRKIRFSSLRGVHSSFLMASHHLVIINCVSLRELYLDCVYISQEIIDAILLTCSLLVKIELIKCTQNLSTIKVTNLPYLYELTMITEDGGSTTFEINNVPNLGLFHCDIFRPQRPLTKNHSIALGSNVTMLLLRGVMMDNTSLDMIKSGLPFLESLTLGIASWTLENFHFTSASMKRFFLLGCPRTLDVVYVYAPKLLFFRFSGGRKSTPSLMFPVSTLKKIMLQLRLEMPVDVSFFLRMRDTLALSSNCDVRIEITGASLPLDIDINDLRTSLPLPPAMKVNQLSFQTTWDDCLWERSSFFDAFFEICHPEHVFAEQDKFRHTNHFGKMMLMEVLEKKTTSATYWPRYLEHVQIRRPDQKKWETVTNAHTSFLQGPAPISVEFKLTWR